MVFHLGHDYFITGRKNETIGPGREFSTRSLFDRGIEECVGQKIECLGRIAGEDQLIGCTTDETGDSSPRLLVLFRCFLGQLVGTAMDCSVGGFVVAPLRI